MAPTRTTERRVAEGRIRGPYKATAQKQVEVNQIPGIRAVDLEKVWCDPCNRPVALDARTKTLNLSNLKKHIATNAHMKNLEAWLVQGAKKASVEEIAFRVIREASEGAVVGDASETEVRVSGGGGRPQATAPVRNGVGVRFISMYHWDDFMSTLIPAVWDEDESLEPTQDEIALARWYEWREETVGPRRFPGPGGINIASYINRTQRNAYTPRPIATK